MEFTREFTERRFSDIRIIRYQITTCIKIIKMCINHPRVASCNQIVCFIYYRTNMAKYLHPRSGVKRRTSVGPETRA